MALIQIRNLRVGYRVYEGLLKVLNGVNIDVEEGEKVGIIGESACGKTTTVKTVMRILAKNSVFMGGEVLYRGKDIMKMNSKEILEIRRRKFSMIFQDPSAALNPVFTIREQFYDIIKYSSEDKLTKVEIHERAIKLLRQAALPEPERVLDSYPFQLSGGMKQRVNIAMALVSANELLIADEPGTALDVTIEDQILRLLKKIVDERKISIILITHALGTVKHFVDRVYVMYAGTVVETGPTEKVFKNPMHPYTKLLIDSVPKLTGGGVPEGIPGVVPSYLNPPTGCRFVTRCPYAMQICKDNAPGMYEVERDHYASCFLYGKEVFGQSQNQS
jgi:peptide/nickel transport system ATP-binding protein